MPGWIHLHIASAFSRQYGTTQPEELLSHVAADHQDFAGLVDRDGVFGAVRWVQACAAAGVAPVVGVDLAYDWFPRQHEGRRSPAHGGRWVPTDAPRALIYARGGAGWAALSRVISAAHVHPSAERGHPRLSRAMLAQHHAGLQVILGPQSDVGRLLARRQYDAAHAALAPWREIFGDQLVIGVVSHRMPNHHPFSTVSAARMWQWANAQGVRVVFTNAVRMLRRDQAPVADVLDAARLLVSLDSSRAHRNNGEAYLKSRRELDELAQEVAHAAGQRDARQLLAHTRQFAAQCALAGPGDLGIGNVFVPEREVILGSREEASADALVRDRCEGALERRYPSGDLRRVARTRLADELHTITVLGFAGYFLTVAEVVHLIRTRGVRVAARGSGAGSLVNYLLGISNIDPLAHGLLMERFLSPLRSSLPDIDIDVESARRTEIYTWILERFGSQRVACVSMMETYRARHAIRDVGAALGMPATDIDVLAKSLPHVRARNVRTALAELPELRTSGFGRLAAQGQLDGVLSLVEALDGLPRHIALHPCGVLLSDLSLLDRTPVEPSAAGFPMSQFDKDDVETLGLLKLDVLGVRMQSAIAHTLAEVQRVQHIAIDIDEMPHDDADTFALISSTRTLGCFQIESPGQRELIGKFAPDRFSDLIIDISLFRPGPMKSDMITPFLQARQGWRKPSYLHPDLEPILAETYGVVVFHEQVLRIVATMTGCTLAQADEIRRSMGSTAGQQSVRDWFCPLARDRGYSAAVVEETWEVLRAFASFGFCKAHAAAFALPTYQSAWLKTHYPAAFYAGILTHDPGMYPKRLLLDDARHHGVSILGLDINRSDAEYRVQECPVNGFGIRIPFRQINGIHESEVAGLVDGQPYHSLSDVWQRAGIRRPTAESLVIAGAFDTLYGFDRGSRRQQTRRDLLLQIAELDRHRIPAITGGTQLTFDVGATDEMAVSGLTEMTRTERVRAELDVLGLDVSCHLLDFYEPMLAELRITRATDLLKCRSGQHILVAGVKVATQTPPTRSGRRVIFCTLDDASGAVDLAFFDDVQPSYAQTVFSAWMLVARGQVRRTGPRGVSIRATGCWELSELREHWLAGGASAVWAHIDQDQPESTVQVPRRVRVHASGIRQSPYADIRPAGSAKMPSKLWHSSPGSSGW
jgi:error-prone DNA polymerase